MNENKQTIEEEQNELSVSRDSMAKGLEKYVDKIINKEINRVYVLSNDEKEEEVVMIDPEEYWYLKKSLRELNRCKKLMQMSTEGMFEEIQKDLKTLKEDMDILKFVK
jgi:predicted patatin/cPLA2 family phospholipase